MPVPEDTPTRNLIEFVRESNRIEGIVREPTQGELEAHQRFLRLTTVGVPDVEQFVAEVAARPLRRAIGQDVYVGGHTPPAGGPRIERRLKVILAKVNAHAWSPYVAHVRYELLHPFMDGNGRSGRVLWAWQMHTSGQDPFALSFLHRFYYQALDGARLA